MDHNMKQMQETANLHMHRDIESVRKWVCECDDCKQIRSLIGMEKTLEVRPLVRRIEEIESALENIPDGPDAEKLLRLSLQLHDELATVMAK
jgi:hypothetical protein